VLFAIKRAPIGFATRPAEQAPCAFSGTSGIKVRRLRAALQKREQIGQYRAAGLRLHAIHRLSPAPGLMPHLKP
jgi:hypothetical protein